MNEKNHIVEINPVPAGLEEAARLAGELARTRQRSKSLSDQADKAEEELRKLPAAQKYDELHEALSKNIEKEKEIETNLRSTALEVGIELQMKNPAPGITITKKTTFTIEDEADTLKACHESYPQLIEEKIKKTELRKIVVALGEAIKGTILSIEEFGQVKIAGNLEELYLEDGNDVPF
jgi:hypothetical protein